MNILKKLSSLFRKKPQEIPEANFSETQVWDIVDGPYAREDFPQEELYDEGIEEDDNWMLVAKVVENGKVGLVNLWFTDLEEARQMKDYFYSNISPLTLASSEYYKPRNV